MKAALVIMAPLLAAAPLVLAHDAPESEPPAIDNPAKRELPQPWRSAGDARPTSAECRDTIRHVREENGQPALRREAADPDAPLLIAAVDHRIDGCGVLVMRRDTSDVRPVPEPSEGPVELIPAD